VSAPSFDAGHLERIYNVPVVRAQRAQIRELLGTSDGELAVDLGCGPGHLAAELVEDVGVRGVVVGLDREPNMVLAARGRVPVGRLRLVNADVTAVPIRDGAVDRAVAVQVLEYVPDVAAALAEVRRLLRPGGTAVVVDTDWRSAVWHTDDRSRTDAVLRAWETHFVHPHLPTAMPGLARAAGFRTVDVVALPMVETMTVGDTYSLGMAATIARYVGRSDPELAGGWRQDVTSQAAAGRYFFSVNRFATVVQG
jgi:arsenite methyltransferase